MMIIIKSVHETVRAGPGKWARLEGPVDSGTVLYCLQSSPLLESTLLVECGPLHSVIGCYLDQMLVLLKFCMKRRDLQGLISLIYLFQLYRFSAAQLIYLFCGGLTDC